MKPVRGPAALPGMVEVLKDQGLRPVLVDVGASKYAPEVWTPIARLSVYVGFDPDLRSPRAQKDGDFALTWMVDKAVVGDASEQAQFYFTSSPYCSSTLPPDTEALDRWFFAPLFEVVSTGAVRAATLNQVAEELKLPSIDWIKTDSQGTDLRVVTALTPGRFDGLLAVDIEPGLIDAYRGEDLFVHAHPEFTARGFWLSDLTLGQCVRLRRDTFEALRGRFGSLGAEEVERRVRTSPGWTNARYLRTLEAMEGQAPERYVLLWAFALLDNQLGYALDVAVEYARRFGASALSARLADIPLAAITAD